MTYLDEVLTSRPTTTARMGVAFPSLPERAGCRIHAHQALPLLTHVSIFRANPEVNTHSI